MRLNKHELSTLALGEPNITIEIYKNLKRLLIITFNIEAIRIQRSNCSHPVKFPITGIRNLRFISQPNLIFKNIPW